MTLFVTPCQVLSPPAPFKGVGVPPWRAFALGVRQQVPFRELGTVSNACVLGCDEFVYSEASLTDKSNIVKTKTKV